MSKKLIPYGYQKQQDLIRRENCSHSKVTEGPPLKAPPFKGGPEMEQKAHTAKPSIPPAASALPQPNQGLLQRKKRQKERRRGKR